jgi:predicted lipid carrier protein YhbT
MNWKRTLMYQQARPVAGAPRLPRPLSLPLGLLPGRFHSQALALTLNRVFSSALRNDELDFLRNRVLSITVRDAVLGYRLILNAGSFASAPADRAPDVGLNGDLYDFLLLATRREDPDTLFFQRRLRIEGSTELGLLLKNYLDTLQELPLPRPLHAVLDRAVDLYGRVF